MPIVTALLVRGVANLDSTSILVAGAPIFGAWLVVFYARKLLARRRCKVPVGRPVSVSDARLYGRYRTITDALGGWVSFGNRRRPGAVRSQGDARAGRAGNGAAR